MDSLLAETEKNNENPSYGANCKIFLEQAFAIFFRTDFGLGFAGPCGIYKTRQVTGENLRNLGTLRRHGQNEPQFLFLKIANNAFLKNSIS
jgi:hypothetical protein